MPLIAVNLSDKLLQDIRDLIDKGRYATLESFIEIGAFNQLALERGASPAEIVERGHRRSSSDAPVVPDKSTAEVKKSPAKRVSSGKDARKGASVQTTSKVDAVEPVTEAEASAVFARFSHRSLSKAIPLKMPQQPQSGERIFGQVNRLFPLKLVCRWLATTADEEGEWPKYATIAAPLSDDAGTIGSLLDDWDNALERERGGELATALPRRKNNASLDRFLSQFVARITRASEISEGAVCQYSFARFEDSTLALTEQGMAFAALQSPILDAYDKESRSALSKDEAEFLASHIRTWVPTEWSDMRTVLGAVQAGKASPTEVATAVRVELPPDWSESMVQTHVSGVIARLGEIRLLSRSWQGRNVRYELGEADHVTSFLKSQTEGHS